MIKRIRYGSIRILFWAILLFAISISGLRYALSDLGLYKADIEALLSKQLGTTVTIERIQGVLNGIKPELALQNIQVYSLQDGAATVQLKEIHLGINIITAISQPLLEAIRVSIIGANVSITRLPAGGISIEGLPNSDQNEQPTWLFRGRQYTLIDSEILWHDKKRNAEPVQLKHVNISLYNDDQQHKIFFKAELPESLGQSLQLAIEFTGNPFVQGSMNALLFMQGKDIQMAKFITGDLPFDFSFTRGIGNFSVWSRWQQEKMTQMSGSIHLHDGIIKDSQKGQYPIKQLDLEFKSQKHQQQWHLALKNSVLSTKNTTLEVEQFALAFEYDTQGDLNHLALNCPQLALEPLSKIIQNYKILPADLHQQLQTIALQGEVKDLLLLANPVQQTFTINGQVEQIKSRPVGDIPGVDDLSIYIKGSEQGGVIQLSSQQLGINAPRVLRKPLNFNNVLSNLHWQHGESWTFSSSQLELNTDHFKSTSKFSLTLADGEQPTFMSLQSSFDIPDVAHVPHYLPAGLVNEATEYWLDQAFVAGSVKQGGILFYGALPDYPFLKHEGIYEVLFAAKDFELHYAPEWQDIQGLSAEVRFFANSMNINIHQGRSNQAVIKQANVAIDSFNTSEYIDIQGDIKSELSEAVQFLTHSPFKEQAIAFNDNVVTQGSAAINVDLKIPLAEQALKANIRVKAQNASAKITSIDLAISKINADFVITENGIFSKQLTAHALGFPISAAVTSSAQSISTTLFGQMSIKNLAEHYPDPFWTYLKGTSKYHIELDFPQASAQLCNFQLYTDLAGIAVDFPTLAKPVAQAHPFYLKLGIDSTGLNTVNMTYENRLAPKNRLDINLKKIAPNWQGLIHSPIASGSVFIPMEFNKNTEISMSLKQLNLSALTEIDFNTDDTPLVIKNIPGINLESQALYWNNYNLGSLTLNTQPSNSGLTIKQCKVSSPTNDLSLTGTWQQNNKQNSSAISGQLLSQNFGELLQQTQLSNNIVDTLAELHFSINWPAAPYEISGPIISGSLDSHLTNGRILGVDPGLGRVLGALDTWKLGKRLRFDFSDVTAKGLSFSESTAHFTFKNGLVRSQDLHINAMPAEINIDGFTDLASKQINLRATVLPKFPIAGTIIGNVANAVSKTFVGNEHAGGLILSLLYEISGTWENFKINRHYNSVLPPPPKSRPNK